MERQDVRCAWLCTTWSVPSMCRVCDDAVQARTRMPLRQHRDSTHETAFRILAGDATPRAAADDDEPVAQVGGINVHAKQCVAGRDRAQIERLCRYITRPPLSQKRLTRRTDGRLELELKKV